MRQYIGGVVLGVVAAIAGVTVVRGAEPAMTAVTLCAHSQTGHLRVVHRNSGNTCRQGEKPALWDGHQSAIVHIHSDQTNQKTGMFRADLSRGVNSVKQVVITPEEPDYFGYCVDLNFTPLFASADPILITYYKNDANGPYSMQHYCQDTIYDAFVAGDRGIVYFSD